MNDKYREGNVSKCDKVINQMENKSELSEPDQMILIHVNRFLEDSLALCFQCNPFNKKRNYNQIWNRVNEDYPCLTCMEIARIQGRINALW